MVIVMRAMGVESDQEIMELIGSEPGVAALMASTVQEAKAAGIFTKQQALEYLGAPHFHAWPVSVRCTFLPLPKLRRSWHISMQTNTAFCKMNW